MRRDLGRGGPLGLRSQVHGLVLLPPDIEPERVWVPLDPEDRRKGRGGHVRVAWRHGRGVRGQNGGRGSRCRWWRHCHRNDRRRHRLQGLAAVCQMCQESCRDVNVDCVGLLALLHARHEPGHILGAVDVAYPELVRVGG